MSVEESEVAYFAVIQLGAYLPHEVEWEMRKWCGRGAGCHDGGLVVIF